jgi:peptide/nickel transport system ATP-binding protein
VSLLEIDDLAVTYARGASAVTAVDGVSLQVDAGEALGVVGESGCGKTTLGLAVPGLLPGNARISRGRVVLDGRDLVGLGERELNAVRWTTAAFVFQGAMNSLNPVHRVERQIAEPILAHEPGTSRADAVDRVRQLLDQVGVAPDRARSYPHEFSGGMRQRVMIAMALACRPRLLIADEPTTALDVVSQAQVLDVFDTLRRRHRQALVLISHDLAAIARTCERVVVMYAGVVVESGPTSILGPGDGEASHPYTRALIRSRPRLRGPRILADALPGHPPDLALPMVGCRFSDRCPVAIDICRTVVPPTVTVADGHSAACHLVAEEVS